MENTNSCLISTIIITPPFITPLF